MAWSAQSPLRTRLPTASDHSRCVGIDSPRPVWNGSGPGTRSTRTRPGRLRVAGASAARDLHELLACRGGVLLGDRLEDLGVGEHLAVLEQLGARLRPEPRLLAPL